MTDKVIEFSFPRTADGWRDWRKEIEAITKDRARSYEDGRGAPFDHQFVIIVGNLLDEIDRLRKMVRVEENVADVFRIDAEKYRAERDEARRSVCEMSIQLGGVYRRVGGKTVEVTTPEGCAEIMRWDCFKEEP